MLSRLLQLIFGSKNDRFIKQCQSTLNVINGMEDALTKLSDEALASKTDSFKQRLSEGESLDSLLPECFAVVREASKRTLGLRHHDVQLIGGMALHQGNIAEMATGEGKTLVATLPVYLNALTGKGVHVVTVNHYLANRDAQWMGKIYQFLGLTVGVIIPELNAEQRKQAYLCDITYASNSELGFDYLRDNMATHLSQKVQRPPFFAIIDEVDSILIDEARTPLIISGPIGKSSELYRVIYPLVASLEGQEDSQDEEADANLENTTDVRIQRKERQVSLTEQGLDKIEALLRQHKILEPNQDLYSDTNAMLLHFIDACLQAKFLLQKDTHYIVKNNEVMIIDEHTGRTLQGRRWSGGRHQATEAKEGVSIQEENQTLASITYQNYFKLYQKLSGMTGTADTESEELEQIYNLQVLVIPKNKTCLRKDANDVIYLTKTAKYKAIVKEIQTRHEQQQPVLVGTTSIEDSEYLSSLLKQVNIQHNVLNAKQHAKEADIIATAGEPGKVTIATNMAGRGTDIILGGRWDQGLSTKQLNNPEAVSKAQEAWQAKHSIAVKAGGLHVLATERHECRRVDNQLRGRCARQGDPGSSQFFLSLEDHLFRLFPQGVLNMIKKSSKDPDEYLEASMLNHAIASNQKKMESYYFDIRKQLLKYDNISNEHRQALYQERNELLSKDSIHDNLTNIFISACEQLLKPFRDSSKAPGLTPPQQQALTHKLQSLFPYVPDSQSLVEIDEKTLAAFYLSGYQKHTDGLLNEQRFELEKNLMLQIIDQHWKEHLLCMEDLKENIGFKGYAQKNPEQEFKLEAHRLFEAMFKQIHLSTMVQLCRIKIATEPESARLETSTQGVRMQTPLD